MKLPKRTLLMFLLLLLSENSANNDEHDKINDKTQSSSSYANAHQQQEQQQQPKSRTIRALAALADDFIGEALESALKGDFSVRNLFEGAFPSGQDADDDNDEEPLIKENTHNQHKRSKRQAAQARSFAIDPDLVYEGIFLPDNVAIYVGRRFVDFLSSVVGWGIIAALYTTSDTTTSTTIRRSSLSSRVIDRATQLSDLIGDLDDSEIAQILELEKTRMKDFGNSHDNSEENELAAIRRFLLRKKLVEKQQQQQQQQHHHHRHNPHHHQQHKLRENSDDVVDFRFK